MPFRYYITPDEYEIAAKNGIRRQTVNNRVRDLAWSVNEAITKPPKRKRKYSEYEALLEIAKSNDISKSTFSKRLDRGWSPIDAATRKKVDREHGLSIGRRRHREKKYTENDALEAEKNRIPRRVMAERINKLDWDVHQAKTVPVLDKTERASMGKRAVILKYGNINKLIFLKKEERRHIYG